MAALDNKILSMDKDSPEREFLLTGQNFILSMHMFDKEPNEYNKNMFDMCDMHFQESALKYLSFKLKEI